MTFIVSAISHLAKDSSDSKEGRGSRSVDERCLGSESQDLSHVLPGSFTGCVILEHGSKLHFADKEPRLRGDQDLDEAVDRLFQRQDFLS